MANIDSTEALNQVRASLGLVAYTATTAPIRGRLMTANGTAAAAGTEVVNAGGSTYASQDVGAALPASPSSLPVLNTAPVTWTNLPATTVTGLELWDSNATPKRKWFGALAASKTVALGDSLTIAAGALSITTG